MPSAALRATMGTKRPKFGSFVIEFDSPGMGQILKAAGCEYALLDLEHSGFGYDQLKRMLRFYQAADLPVIVSTVGGDYDMVARALDMGADGIQPAKVGSAEEARAILDHVAMRRRARGGSPSESPTTATGSARRRQRYGPPTGTWCSFPRSRRRRGSRTSRRCRARRRGRHLDRPLRSFGRHGNAGEVRPSQVPGSDAARGRGLCSARQVPGPHLRRHRDRPGALRSRLRFPVLLR